MPMQILYHTQTVSEILFSVTLAGKIFLIRLFKGKQCPLFTCDHMSPLKIFTYHLEIPGVPSHSMHKF